MAFQLSYVNILSPFINITVRGLNSLSVKDHPAPSYSPPFAPAITFSVQLHACRKGRSQTYWLVRSEGKGLLWAADYPTSDSRVWSRRLSRWIIIVDLWEARPLDGQLPMGWWWGSVVLSLSRIVDHISLSCSTVLTWISIYWFSRAGPAASLRIYYEVLKADPQLLTTLQPTTIPLGYSYFPRELISLPRRYVLVLGIYKTQLTALILTFFLI